MVLQIVRSKSSSEKMVEELYYMICGSANIY